MPEHVKEKTDSSLKDLLKDDKALEEFIYSLYDKILDELFGIYSKNTYYLDDEISSYIRPIVHEFGIKDSHFNFERILFWDVLDPDFFQEIDQHKWKIKPEYNLNPVPKDQIINEILKKYLKDWYYFKSNLEKEVE